MTKIKLEQENEDLLQRVFKAEASRDLETTKDVNRRKEFAKAFNWRKQKSVYNYDEEIILPSWEEIFIEIGKLLQQKKVNSCKQDIEDINNKIDEIQRNICSEIHPNFPVSN